MKIKRIVKRGYNKTAHKYDLRYNKNKNYKFILDKVINKIPKGSRALDIGCGTGIPVDKILSKHFEVLGIDISKEMIKLAKKNVPNVKFKVKDSLKLKFRRKSFGLITAFFTLIHIPKKKIPFMIKKIYNFLKKDGYFVVSMGTQEEDKIASFFEEKMYYANFEKKDFERLLKEAGFKIIYSKILDYKFAEGSSKQLFIIAKK